MLLAAFHLVADARKHQKWCQPFVWIGMNSITVYLAIQRHRLPPTGRTFRRRRCEEPCSTPTWPKVLAISLLALAGLSRGSTLLVPTSEKNFLRLNKPSPLLSFRAFSGSPPWKGESTRPQGDGSWERRRNNQFGEFSHPASFCRFSQGGRELVSAEGNGDGSGGLLNIGALISSNNGTTSSSNT